MTTSVITQRRSTNWAFRIFIGTLVAIIGAAFSWWLIEATWVDQQNRYISVFNEARIEYTELDFDNATPADIADAHWQAAADLREINPPLGKAEFHRAVVEAHSVCARAYDMIANAVENPLAGLFVMGQISEKTNECNALWDRIDIRGATLHY